MKIREIYNLIPGQLDEKNKRFKFSAIQSKNRFEEYEESFIWLKNAGVALPVYNVSEPKIPLMASEKRNLFKLFLSDIGLLTSFYSDETKIKILSKDVNINNGSLFENVVAQELSSKKLPLYYYNSKKNGELDFVVEINGKVTPIEVKSGKDYKKHSALNNVLKVDKYEIESAYVFSSKNVEVIENKIYMPIYMIKFLENTKIENFIYHFDLKGV